MITRSISVGQRRQEGHHHVLARAHNCSGPQPSSLPNPMPMPQPTPATVTIIFSLSPSTTSSTLQWSSISTSTSASPTVQNIVADAPQDVRSVLGASILSSQAAVSSTSPDAKEVSNHKLWLSSEIPWLDSQLSIYFSSLRI